MQLRFCRGLPPLLSASLILQDQRGRVAHDVWTGAETRDNASPAPTTIMAGRTNDRERSLLSSLFAVNAARETGDYPPGRLNEKYRRSDLSRRVANFPWELALTALLFLSTFYRRRFIRIYDAWVLEFILFFLFAIWADALQHRERKKFTSSKECSNIQSESKVSSYFFCFLTKQTSLFNWSSNINLNWRIVICKRKEIVKDI